MSPLTIAIIVVAVVLVAGGGATTVFQGFWWPFGNIVGSGNVVTRQESFTGFTGVQVGSGFKLTITQGSSYSVSVATDDNIIDSVQVVESGSTLTVGFRPGFGYQTTTLGVDITMPDLNQLDISGGVRATVTGMTSPHDVTVTASGGSSLVMTGAANGLTMDASGGSSLDLSGYHVSDAHVNLSGGSQATVNPTGTLDGSVSGGSRLYYLGPSHSKAKNDKMGQDQSSLISTDWTAVLV
ncbi:MAG: head GIN domain-containing protein [Conexivisphaerales archaeon]